MKNLKEDLDFLLPFFKIIVCFCAIVFLLFGIVYFAIKIDTSRLGKIKHCPSCGIDLLRLR